MAVKFLVLLSVVLASLIVFQDAAYARELTEANGLYLSRSLGLSVHVCMNYINISKVYRIIAHAIQSDKHTKS